MKNEEFDVFKNVVQEIVPPFLNTITHHPYFLNLHPDKQTDFLCDIQETFEKKLGIELDPMCDNFNEIFDAWEKQDKVHQFMLKVGEEYRKQQFKLALDHEYEKVKVNRRKKLCE